MSEDCTITDDNPWKYPVLSDCCNAEVNVTRFENPAAVTFYTVMYDCKKCGKACTVS